MKVKKYMAFSILVHAERRYSLFKKTNITANGADLQRHKTKLQHY